MVSSDSRSSGFILLGFRLQFVFGFQFLRVSSLVCFWVLVSQGLESSLFCLRLALPKKRHTNTTHTHTNKIMMSVAWLERLMHTLIWMGIGASGPKTSEPQCRRADPKFRNPSLRSTQGHDFVNVVPPFIAYNIPYLQLIFDTS